MYLKRFHEIWGLPLLVFLLCTFKLAAQCPETKSAAYPMMPAGLPTLTEIKLIDFLVNPEDAALYEDVEISRVQFVCSDLGVQEISIVGIDDFGQIFSCKELVWVYDSVFLCSNTINNPKAVGGRIITERNEPMVDVSIGLKGMVTNYFKSSDENGLFLFEDFPLADYDVIPTKTDDIRNGITTMDVLLLQKHILGLKKLGSPYKIIAADVNSSESITAFDMVLLRQIILSTIDAFPNTPSWRFIDANFEFTDDTNPFLDDFSESFQISGTNFAPYLNNRFVAVKVGDFNNSVRLNSVAGGRASKAIPNFNLAYANSVFNKGEEIELDLKFEGNEVLEGMQFALNIDENQLEFVGFESELTIEENHFSENNGALSFSWTAPLGQMIYSNEKPFTMRFRAKKKGQITDALKLTQVLAAEIYVEDGAIIPFGLKLEPLTASTTTFQVFDNYPNPFSVTTTFPFYLPEDGDVNLSVFDVNGQLIYQDNNHFSQGSQTFSLNKNLSVSGIYFYKLTSDFGVAKGKMTYQVR